MQPGSTITLRNLSTGETFRVISTYDFPVFVRFINWGGNWNMGSNGSTSVPKPPSVESPRPSPNPNDGPIGRQSPTTPTPSAATTPNVSTPSQQSGGTNIAVPFGASATNVVIAEAQAATEAAVAASNYGPAATQQVFYSARTAARDWTTPAPTYLEGVDLPAEQLPVPSQTEEPPQVEEPMPDVPPVPAPDIFDPVEAILTVDPSPGIIPFSLTTLQEGVRAILEQAAQLDSSIVDGVSSTENYLWIGAAALVAGGALQTAWGRKSRSSDPRTLGLDSVLVRWGERNVG
jgi:hypothetical protein